MTSEESVDDEYDTNETIQLLRRDRNYHFNVATFNSVPNGDQGIDESCLNKCGCCGFAPKCLQVFNTTKWAVFFLGLAAFIQGTIVNGMLHFFISTIERRYEMPSYQSGLMSGAFDMASMIFLIPVTYMGGRVTANKPKWIASGTLVVAVGSFVFAFPHFISARYKSRATMDLCVVNNDSTFFLSMDRRWIRLAAGCETVNSSSFSIYFWILFLGNFLHGAGGTPLFTLCIAFIDETVPPEKSSIYLGIYYFFALLGPSVGYGLGGIFIRFYVDFPLVKPSDIEMNWRSPSWVGCWWLGFIICGFLALIIAGIIYCMPKEIKNSQKLSLRVRGMEDKIPYQTFKELPKAFGTLLCNPTYMCVVAVACCEGLLVSGFGAFMPKILEKEFNLTSEMVAVVMGLVALPSALLGLVLGGWLVNYFNLGLRATLKFDIILFILATLCIPGLLIGCPLDTIVGVNYAYFDSPHSSSSQNYSLWSRCNRDCGCAEEIYSPVCGRDNFQYFSACFAGCKKSAVEKLTNTKIFEDCSCVPPLHTLGKNAVGKPEATSLPCKTECPLFGLYLLMFFLYQLLTFTAAVPAISIMLRTVNVNLKSLALGLQWILSRLLGTIPGPVLFGSIMDHNCIVWYSAQCISKGVCVLYKNYPLRVHLVFVTLIWKIGQIFFFCMALIFMKRFPPQLN